MIFGQKTIFKFVNGQIPARGPKNGAQSGQTATYRKTEVMESLIPWSRVRLSQKKWGLYRRSVEKCSFSDQEWALGAASRRP